MKNQKDKFILMVGANVASLALKVTAFNANSTCCWLSHQPKLPTGANKLRKF